MNIRPGRDDDSAGIVALITACWSEYPGCVMDLEHENPHLRAPATHYTGLGGSLTVAEDEEGRVVATVSTLPVPNGDLELKGLYVAAPHRGTGLARQLLRTVETRARDRAAASLILWSDTRFTRAHRFYERAGFIACGAIRALDDLSNSLEYPYRKPMRPRAVERLDPQAARSAICALSDLVGTDDVWTAAAAAVASHQALLFAAWYLGSLSGVLLLDLPAHPDAGHRAELSLLHVATNKRRIGLGAALLAAATDAAVDSGRHLLIGHAAAGTPGDRFLRAAGWTEAGRIPGYEPGADRLVFWRSLQGQSAAPTLGLEAPDPISRASSKTGSKGDCP